MSADRNHYFWALLNITKNRVGRDIQKLNKEKIKIERIQDKQPQKQKVMKFGRTSSAGELLGRKIHKT